MPVFIANSVQTTYIDLIIFFQQPSDEILEDIGAITELKPEVIFSTRFAVTDSAFTKDSWRLKSPASPVSRKSPQNHSHRANFMEISPQSNLHGIISARQFPAEQYPWNYLYRVIFTNSSPIEIYSPAVLIYSQAAVGVSSSNSPPYL